MRLFLFILFFPLLASTAFSQTYLSEKQAKTIVNKICSVSGMMPDFVVTEDHEVKTAIAYVKSNKRYISYNPVVLAELMDSSGTSWAVVNVFAHEIAHHLHGHTLDTRKMSKYDELTCDRYAGFILFKLGATLEESLAVIPYTGNHHGSETHPSREARESAVINGWSEAKAHAQAELRNLIVDEDPPLFSLRFRGDEKVYYITSSFDLVWYDRYGNTVIAGTAASLDKELYPYSIRLDGDEFFISQSGSIWNPTNYNAMIPVGKALSITR